MHEELNVITPNIYEQQIILTCKGHNKNKDTIEAIRNILAQQLKLKTKYINNNIIYRHMVKIMQKYTNSKNIKNIIYNLFENGEVVSIVDMIHRIISILFGIKVIDKNGVELIKLEVNRDILDWEED